MTDPRAENCRAFHVDAYGKVDGVELRVEPWPDTDYKLVRVELIGEEAAKGQTVATCIVLDENGIQTAEEVVLAWPWPGLTAYAGMGNQNGQHMITNGFTPPAIGPLALYVGHGLLNNSDIVGGLGLPFNRHVSYRATWRKRGAVTPPPPDDNTDAPADLAPVMAKLAAIDAKLTALSEHLGL
jgi:hypothetical protein